MRQFFANLPLLNYNGVMLRDLMSHAALTRQVMDQGVMFYPYTLQDGDTPQSIAFDYYGSIEFDWLVLYSNMLIDPLYDWFMSQDDFDNYIEANYGSLTAAMSTIHHYESCVGGLQYTPTSYAYNTTKLDENGLPLYAVDCYTYETRVNESKRSIKLINKQYASAIALELEKRLA